MSAVGGTWELWRGFEKSKKYSHTKQIGEFLDRKDETVNSLFIQLVPKLNLGSIYEHKKRKGFTGF